MGRQAGKKRAMKRWKAMATKSKRSMVESKVSPAFTACPFDVFLKTCGGVTGHESWVTGYGVLSSEV